MYNTDIVVRYYDIETELMQRIAQRVPKIVEPSKKTKKRSNKKIVKEDPALLCQPCSTEEEEEYEYTIEDVKLICGKLYKDELLSVFYVDTATDKKMDLGITSVIEKMIVDSTFRVILEEIKTELVDINALTGTPTEVENMIRNLEYLIFVTLFNQQIFYIAHKCICQLFTIGTIDPEIIIVLKQKLSEFFNK
jgi:uncharacterized spore protein YtfJ